MTIPSDSSRIERDVTIPYDDLPNGDAHGVFGAEDGLGTLNRQTAATVAAAAALVSKGAVFNLNSPLTWPDPPLFQREPVRHHVYTTAMGNRDDYLDRFYLQGSSQWDGFLHFTDPEIGSYNHSEPQHLGIEKWAQRGIVGRGVLLDVDRWLRLQGETLDWRERRTISVAELESVRQWAGLEFTAGDILVIRTGWVAGYKSSSSAEREQVRTRHDSPGLEASDEMAAYLWDNGISALAADNIGVEAMPIIDDYLHRKVLVRLGMPLGEMWWLDELAADCVEDNRWEFLLVSAPLNLPGGVASTANALALK